MLQIILCKKLLFCVCYNYIVIIICYNSCAECKKKNVFILCFEIKTPFSQHLFVLMKMVKVEATKYKKKLAFEAYI